MQWRLITRVVSEVVVALGVTISAGCVGADTAMMLPEAAYRFGSGAVPIDPRPYRVNAGEFPTYRVSVTRQPPPRAFFMEGKLRTLMRPIGPVLPGDSWNVRFKFNNWLMVHSTEFDRRECTAMSGLGLKVKIGPDGTCGIDWCLYITEEGDVTGGWDNNCRPGDEPRIFIPDPEAVRRQDWGPPPFFDVREKR